MEFLKLNITLYKCHEGENTSGNSIDASTANGIFTQAKETSSDTSTTASSPIMKNVLGDQLYTSLQDFFKLPAENVEDEVQYEEVVEPELLDPCRLQLSSVEVVITPREVILWMLTIVFSVLICLLYGRTRKLFQLVLSKVRLQYSIEEILSSRKRNIMQTVPESAVAVTKDDTDIIDKDTDESVITVIKTASAPSATTEQSLVKLFNVPSRSKNKFGSETDIGKFLEETTNKLFSKLDRLLLKGSSTLDQTQSAIATPRLARRPIGRRPRIGSSPSLQLQGASLSESNSNNQEKTQSWEQLKLYSTSLGWKFPRTVNIDQADLNRCSQKLLHYFERVCPISTDTWKATILIVNYVLYLMKSEMVNLIGKSSSPCRFLRFQPTGSTIFGTKVSRLNTFDILMHVQSPILPKTVIRETECESRVQISPGMILLGVDKKDCVGAEKSMTSSVNIAGERLFCLSSKSYQKGVEDLIDECLQNLYNQTRTSMDRLPFKIRRAPCANLQLNIDTRALVGLGESEIKVNISPIIPIATEGILQSPLLYACPPAESFDTKIRAEAQNSLNPEILWRLQYDEFEEAFSKGVEMNMQMANVNSSHYTCLMILKALLTGCIKNNLLDRGVLPSNYISTILNFLVLESVPEQWTYDLLSDRFSDVIHFIREAYTNGRLPNFFMNNPHLADKMPLVRANKLLTWKKQQNLLSDSRREGLDKCLEYMKDRLREVGLADCVKEEYSADMWEYEFFLFN